MTTMIWFDFGGVLSPPMPELFAEYERRTGVPTSLLQRAMAEVAHQMGMPTLAPVELAVVTEREWAERITARIRDIDPLVDTSVMEPDFGRQWFSGHVVNARMRQFAVDLRTEGHRVGILTNNVVEWEPYWRHMVRLDGLVDDIVDSSRVGWRKPDARIFDLAAHRNAVSARSCILLDDLEENCDAARRCGWRAVHVTPGVDVEAEVRGLLEA